MKFDIKNCLTGKIQFTAEIDCAEDAPMSVKIGLAVRWGIKAGADLGGAYLSRAYLTRADLGGANLTGAYLTGANLTGAYLGGANLTGADLGGANLTGAYLGGADLAGAYLTGANLSRAYLTGANLTGAYLGGADLRGEKIKRILASVQRVSDGYTFILFDMEVGPPKIVAGCRFLTVADYAAHVAKEYPDTDKARETLRILDYFDDVIAAESLAAARAGQRVEA